MKNFFKNLAGLVSVVLLMIAALMALTSGKALEAGDLFMIGIAVAVIAAILT